MSTARNGTRSAENVTVSLKITGDTNVPTIKRVGRNMKRSPSKTNAHWLGVPLN